MSILEDMDDNHKIELRQFITKLNRFLMKRFGYKDPLGKTKIKPSIRVNLPRVKIYFRYRIKFGIWKHETFVISELEFQEERKGHGAAMLKFIYDHCVEYGIEYIGIEYANVKSGAFALKYGFHETDEEYCYLVAVKDLHNKFVNIL